MDDKFDCYFCQIYFDERFGNIVSFLTHWEGFADEEKRVELRAASKTCSSRLKDFCDWSDDNQLQLVRSLDELMRFWEKGGAAAIEANLAEKYLPEKLKAEPVTNSGFGSFSNLKTPIDQATRQAPSKKLRMKVIERDNHRCRVCGQNPSMDTNIVLHVHHVRPWSERGATVENNLVTLCHTCHGGLDPHWNFKLAMLIEDLENEQRRWNTPPRF